MDDRLLAQVRRRKNGRHRGVAAETDNRQGIDLGEDLLCLEVSEAELGDRQAALQEASPTDAGGIDSMRFDVRERAAAMLRWLSK